MRLVTLAAICLGLPLLGACSGLTAVKGTLYSLAPLIPPFIAHKTGTYSL